MDIVALVVSALRIAVTEIQLAMADSAEDRAKFEAQLEVDRATFRTDARAFKDQRAANNAAGAKYADEQEPGGGS